MDPGTRLRRARERLGLTFRDVERASYELASQRGRPDFVLHISRLADIENHGVTPSLYKLYSLCAIYHLDPRQVCRWYEVPMEEHFSDGLQLAAPHTHLAAGPQAVRVPLRFDPGFDPRRTNFLTRMVERWGELEAALLNRQQHYRHGYIGTEDCTMAPLVRPGSLVLVDTRLREVPNHGWRNEHERPIFFLELREGYRCGWCRKENGALTLEPHPLSFCRLERWRTPEEAEVVGRVVGVAMRLAPA